MRASEPASAVDPDAAEHVSHLSESRTTSGSDQSLTLRSPGPDSPGAPRVCKGTRAGTDSQRAARPARPRELGSVPQNARPRHRPSVFNRQIDYMILTILLWMNGCPASAARLLRIQRAMTTELWGR